VVFTYTGTNGTSYGPTSLPPTAAGSYTVVGTVSSANNSGTASGTLVIAKAPATVTLGGLSQAYTGSPLAATAATTPTGLIVGLKYIGVNGTTYGPSSTPPTSAGSYTVVGTVSNANYSGAASGTMVIGQLASATSVTSSANPVLAQTALTFTATVSAQLGTPSGTVTFLDGTTPLGQATLTGHTATLITSSLTDGSHSITADYSGDTDFAGSASSPLTQSILDFSLAPTSGTGGSGGAPVTTQTTNPGGTATYPLTIVPTVGIRFPTPIVLTVTGMPPGATAVVTPSPWTQLTSTSWSFPAQTPLGPLSLAIQVPSSSVAHLDPRSWPDRKLPPVVFVLLLLPFAGRLRALRQRLSAAISLLLLALASIGAMAALAGCGATSGLFADQAKTYTLTVTATSGTLSHATSLTLTVK
jgi:MBG domain/Bacterial Ig-like domain (group 3)